MKVKLRFVKNDDENIDVKIIIGQTEKKFNYVEMIRQLYSKETLEPLDFDGEFSVEERESLSNLAQQISEKVNESLHSNES
jgi:hypothetical protein